MASDGGPAFPHVASRYEPTPGMSLRDWFAGQAMLGLIAHPGNSGAADKLAEISFAIADAMLAIRLATSPPGTEPQTLAASKGEG